MGWNSQAQSPSVDMAHEYGPIPGGREKRETRIRIRGTNTGLCGFCHGCALMDTQDAGLDDTGRRGGPLVFDFFSCFQGPQTSGQPFNSWLSMTDRVSEGPEEKYGVSYCGGVGCKTPPLGGEGP